MDLLDYIISYMNNKVEVASSLFDNIYGLCDTSKDSKYYSYTGNGQGKPVTDYDKKKGTLLWIKNGSVRVTADAPQVLKDASCSDYVTIDYLLRGICVIKKSNLPCDNATAIDQSAQEILHKLGGKDKLLRQAIGASFIDIKPTGYTELKNITDNLNYAAFGLDYTVSVVLKKSCIPQLCDDVPLPTCEFSVALRNTDGKLIYTINQSSANPFTLAVQQVVDGNGNTVNVPYDPDTPFVTDACTVFCDDANVTVNGSAFDTVASGGTLDVPVQYENGTPVGTIVLGVVEIPNPIVCADATAVLKDTAGATISSTNIPSGTSQDIVAPDGDITVNSVAFDSVLSDGSLDIEVRQETGATQVGSKQGQFWRIDDSDISINSTPFDSVAAEDSLNIAVKDTNGVSVGSEVAGEWIVPAFEQDLVTRVNFDTGSPLEYTITIDSDTAGTYTAATFGGSTASATYEKNAVVATLPIAVIATDTLKIIPDAVNGFVRLTGTY